MSLGPLWSGKTVLHPASRARESKKQAVGGTVGLLPGVRYRNLSFSWEVSWRHTPLTNTPAFVKLSLAFSNIFKKIQMKRLLEELQLEATGMYEQRTFSNKLKKGKVLLQSFWRDKNCWKCVSPHFFFQDLLFERQHDTARGRHWENWNLHQHTRQSWKSCFSLAAPRASGFPSDPLGGCPSHQSQANDHTVAQPCWTSNGLQSNGSIPVCSFLTVKRSCANTTVKTKKASVCQRITGAGLDNGIHI